MVRKLSCGIAAAIALATIAGPASAASVFTGSGTVSGTAAKAEVDFDVVGSFLTVVLKNTSTVSTTQPALLMGVYWNSNSLTASTLNSVSPNGSTILGTGVKENAGWFGYGLGDAGVASLVGKHGVAASAYGFGTEIGRLGLDGVNPGTPNSLDGPDGGLASTVGTSSGKTVLQNSVLYKIDISGVSGFNAAAFLASISGVEFTYGTGSSDYSHIPGTPDTPGGTPNTPVPVPAAAWTGLSLLAGMGALAKLRRKARA